MNEKMWAFYLFWAFLAFGFVLMIFLASGRPGALRERLLFRLTMGRPCRIIADGSRPYLERYYLGQLFGLTFYLHRFVASDPSETMHNHPWDGRSFVLVGGYEEQVYKLPHVVEYIRRRPGAFFRIEHQRFHRVHLARGQHAWTLFVHGKRLHSWGMLRLSDNAYWTFPHSFGEWWKTAPPGGYWRRLGMACPIWQPPTDSSLRMMARVPVDRDLAAERWRNK